jgi:hypothetical protein
MLILMTWQNQQQQPLNQNQHHQREESPAPTQKPQAQSHQQSNVRHIPIFVEGRDEPVLARTSTDEPDYPRRQQSPPQFHRPSHYQQHYEKQHPSSEWSLPFQVTVCGDIKKFKLTKFNSGIALFDCYHIPAALYTL